MWNSYGRNGVAVRTTVGRLKAALEKSERDFAFGRMIHIQQTSPPVGLGFDPADPKHRRLLLMPHFLKRKEYEGEKEVRFVTSGPGSPTKLGVNMNLPPLDWIDEIRLSPKSTLAEVQTLKEIVEKLVPNLPCSKSDLFQGEPPMQSFLASTDESAWNDGSDGIPQIVKKV